MLIILTLVSLFFFSLLLSIKDTKNERHAQKKKDKELMHIAFHASRSLD